jgi:ketosteroid isomerase-like protein
MSQENVEVVRRVVDAYVAGDMESFKSLLARDVEWKQVEEPAAAHGPDAALDAVERWGEMWEDLEFEASEYIDAGATVLVKGTWKGRGMTSGIKVEQSAYYVYTVRDGKVVQMQEYWSGGRDEAFKAAGLGTSQS